MGTAVGSQLDLALQLPRAFAATDEENIGKPCKKNHASWPKKCMLKLPGKRRATRKNTWNI